MHASSQRGELVSLFWSFLIRLLYCFDIKTLHVLPQNNTRQFLSFKSKFRNVFFNISVYGVEQLIPLYLMIFYA